MLDHKGVKADFDQLAVAVECSLCPSKQKWLTDRLGALMLAFGHERDPRRVAAWLSEMTRLLIDLPQDILGEAIDGAVKASHRGFLPSVGEIRAIAEPAVDRRKRQAYQLRAMAREKAERTLEQEARRNLRICTPEELAAIKAEFGDERQ